MERRKITEHDQILFANGTHYDIYEKLGAHLDVQDELEGVYFAVWAPHAQSVSVVGNFNDWNPEANPMERVEPMGIYETFVSGVQAGALYKYWIKKQDGTIAWKADPYGVQCEMRPQNASIVTDLSNFSWHDKKWRKRRSSFDAKKDPMFVYEVHLGSWKKPSPTEEDSPGEAEFYNYRQVAVELAAYIKDMGYTHVELIGIAEHPFDGSWGYQVTNYFAPTSRYGRPEDFQYFVDYMHQQGIGVILDWVPAHFPKDEHGLSEFDGTCLYEYEDPRKGEHPDWGTKIFDFAKNEVRNFLICNALYWVEKYHIDGLRVDAVASMLYLDYGREDGEWCPNVHGGNENLEVIDFLKQFNTIVKSRNPGVVTIAEESTAWPKVTDLAEYGGLEFSLKWNMGWMHDFLEYMKLDPYFRKYNHNLMNFAMLYAYSENFILVLSHDEVVHLKGSMLEKMPGSLEDKFKNLMVGYAFMMGHPGKKLLFMGQDFGQSKEWSESRALDWDLLGEDNHRNLQQFLRKLCELYRKNKCLFQWDCNPAGFEWINADDKERSTFSFVRHSENGKNNLLFLCNFSPVAYPDFRIGTTCRRKHLLVLDSDASEFGGSGKERELFYKPQKVESDGRMYSIAYDLPAYGVAVFQF